SSPARPAASDGLDGVASQRERPGDGMDASEPSSELRRGRKRRGEHPQDPRARAGPKPDLGSAPGDPPVSLLTAAKRTLEMIAHGASLPDILTHLCGAIDAQDPDIISSVMLLDPDGRRL